MMNMRKEKYKITEANYRNRPETKSYQREYGKLYRSFIKGELTLEEFDKLKPKTIKKTERD
jgi:hypothetical protein